MKKLKQMTGAALRKWRERQPSGFAGEKCLTPEEAEVVFRFDSRVALGRSWRRWEDGTHPVPAWLQGLVGIPGAPWATLDSEQVEKAATTVAGLKLTDAGRSVLRWLVQGEEHGDALWSERNSTPSGYRPWWILTLTDDRHPLDGRTMRTLEERGLVRQVSKPANWKAVPYVLTDRGRLVAKA